MFGKNKKKAEDYGTGYVAFSEADAAAAANDAMNPNQQAYEFLDKALMTSSHISKKARKKGVVAVDDVYPITMDECVEMKGWLDKAEEAAANPDDPEFKERLFWLKNMLAWSMERHWTIRWPLIFGCVMSVFIISYCSRDAKKEVGKMEDKLAAIDKWEKQDTTIAYEALSVDMDKWANDPVVINSINSANSYKYARLYTLKKDVLSSEKSIKENQYRLDTATIDKNRKAYEKSIKYSNSIIEKQRKAYDELNEAGFKGVKKDAEEFIGTRLNRAQEKSGKLVAYIILLIILIPLYILASHEFGYSISRNRTEARILGGIYKVLGTISVALFGAGLAMQLLPDYIVETTYMDGHKERHKEADTGNLVVLAIKFMLMIAGVILYCFTSVLLMLYMTVTGLKRNYNWVEIWKKAAVNK